MTRMQFAISRSIACAFFAGSVMLGSASHAATDPAYDAFQSGHYLTAIKEAEKAAAKGDPAAHTLLGEIYSKGYGVKRDDAATQRLYEKAGFALRDQYCLMTRRL